MKLLSSFLHKKNLPCVAKN